MILGCHLPSWTMFSPYGYVICNEYLRQCLAVIEAICFIYLKHNGHIHFASEISHVVRRSALADFPTNHFYLSLSFLRP